VLLALTIPASARVPATTFVTQGVLGLQQFAAEGEPERGILSEHQHHVAEHLHRMRNAVEAPLQRLEHTLNPWVAYGIVPLFVLANAGVSLRGDVGATVRQPVALGIILGLVVGKQIGITAFSWLAVKAGLAVLPTGLAWRHIYGVAWLGGIGFTMSLFIAELAFGQGALLMTAKIGILVASAIAGSVGWLLLRTTLRTPAAQASP
jgi:NhaA family Na+:H+ antiporter